MYEQCIRAVYTGLLPVAILCAIVLFHTISYGTRQLLSRHIYHSLILGCFGRKANIIIRNEIHGRLFLNTLSRASIAASMKLN